MELPLDIHPWDDFGLNAVANNDVRLNYAAMLDKAVEHLDLADIDGAKSLVENVRDNLRLDGNPVDAHCLDGALKLIDAGNMDDAGDKIMEVGDNLRLDAEEDPDAGQA